MTTAASRRQRVAILGATGSVGQSTLDVLSRHADQFEVWALTASRRIDEIAALCVRHRPRFAVVSDAESAKRLQVLLASADVRTEVLYGASALCDVAAAPEVDQVMAAIVGAAGLPSCLAAARAGKRLLLANKEALVVGGALFMQAVREGGATLVPIDSEHSAIFQCLPADPAQWDAWIDHILLTGSGGPFRTRDLATLATVTPDEACAHPNWVMGRKISVDSATMMNKALEFIEARWLFDLPPERIRIVIHPQSIIHSMVACRDGSVLAQLGTPDMRVPIAYGLSFPRRLESGATRLNFSTLSSLTFEPPDPLRFPALALAEHCLHAPTGTTAVLNAANEVAVEAFLAGQLRFTDMHRINADTVEAVAPSEMDGRTLDDLLDLDRRARAHAAKLLMAY